MGRWLGAPAEVAGASWRLLAGPGGALPEAASCSERWGALCQPPSRVQPHTASPLFISQEASTELLMIKACSQDPNEAMAVIAFEK